MFLQAGDSRAPGAKPKSGLPGPGGRVDLEVTELRIDNTKIILDPGHFLKGYSGPGARISSLFNLT